MGFIHKLNKTDEMNNIIKIKTLALLLFLLIQTNRAQLIINEIFLTNGSVQLMTDFNFSNWVEFYNTSQERVSTVGLYLSDDSLDLKKWAFPIANIAPGAYQAYYLTGKNEGIHTNFKADADKGSIYLSNEDGEILEKYSYPKQFYNISYGRYPNAAATSSYFVRPTFQAENTSDTVSQRSRGVSFSHEGGFYDSPVSISLINTLGNGSIYYTTNGSEPNVNSQVYNNPISITQNTVIRARIIENGKMPGGIKTNSYFVGQRKPKLPIISIVTDPQNLFNDTFGIYVAGINGIRGNCSEAPVNWNQDWERAANFEWFDTTQEQKVNLLLGLKIAGGCSRVGAQKSFSVTARSKYGKDRIDYRFFKDREFSNFNSLLARTGANDWSFSLCRDAIIQKLSDRFMDLEHQSVQLSVIFINGEYYGLQHLYERSGEDLIEAKYGYEDGEIDLGERQGISLEGNAEDFNTLLDYVRDNNLDEQEHYNYVASKLDIDNFIEYNIFEIFIGNNDWPGSNSKYWRPKTPGSKWRWILYDTDFGFGLYEHNALHETLAMMLQINDSTTWPNPEWSTRIFRKLMENAEFKRKFINRFYAHINTTFKPEYVIHTIDSVSSTIADEVPYHYQRWNRDGSRWNDFIQELRDFALLRPEIVRSHIRQLLGAGENITVTCRSEAPGFGYIAIDSVIASEASFSGIFSSGAIAKISFIPAAGYTFYRAVRTENGVSKEIYSKNFTDTLNANVEYVLYFEKVQPLADIVINEIAANNKTYPDEFNENDDWIEIFNNGNDTVEISGLFISDSIEEPLRYRIPYSNGNAVTLAPKEYKIIWADGQTAQGPLHVNFKLKSGGENIGIFQKIGEDVLTLDECTYGSITGSVRSYGRFPNITGPFKRLDTASPMAENIDNEPVEITDKNTEGSIARIWYNKSSRQIQIEFDNENNNAKSNIMLSDISGRLILKKQLSNYHENIDVANLKAGIYILILQNKKIKQTHKLLIH